MKLQKFPLDNQTCVVNIGSCMYSSMEFLEGGFVIELLDAFATNDLAFFWDETPNVSAIRVNEDLEMPDFVLSNHEAKYCNRTTATGKLLDFLSSHSSLSLVFFHFPFDNE